MEVLEFEKEVLVLEESEEKTQLFSDQIFMNWGNCFNLPMNKDFLLNALPEE